MHDARDELWQKTFESYYDTYYEELLAGAILRRWIWVDTVTKVLVAVTTSSSAIAGWTLWSQPGLKQLWLLLVSLAALLSIIHASLGVAERVKDWGATARSFFNVRLQLENLRNRMCVDPEFSVDSFLKNLEDLRHLYAETVGTARDDIIQTSSLERACQRVVNDLLASEIVKDEKEGI